MSSTLSQPANAIVRFAENPIFLSTFVSWFLAQLIKAVIGLLKAPRKSAREITLTLMWRTGGMPSSHSSLVVSLAAAVGFRDGLGSSLFMVTLVLALIVIRDSLGVRRSSGLQARLLNQISKDVSEHFGKVHHPVKEIQGHAPLEVLVGALLGLFIAAAFFLL